MPGYGAPPPNYLVWAILTTLFCCLPAGIVAIVFAAQVNGKWMAGDVQGALNSAKNAKVWSIISAVVGPILIVLIWVLFAVVLAAHSTLNIPSGTYTYGP